MQANAWWKRLGRHYFWKHSERIEEDRRTSWAMWSCKYHEVWWNRLILPATTKNNHMFRAAWWSKNSKTCLTVGLLCNSDETYKGQHKSPKCFKARTNLLSMTAIGKKHEIEYHYFTNAWMTTYVKKLNVAFGRKNRKIGLLLDNASIHKIRIPLNNIKLIFLLANTTSNLQALDAGSLLFVDKMLYKLSFCFTVFSLIFCMYKNYWQL